MVTFFLYRSIRLFLFAGGSCLGIGALILLRYLYIFLTVAASGHVQSLILATILMSVGITLVALGILGVHLKINRLLLEELYVTSKQLAIYKRVSDVSSTLKESALTGRSVDNLAH